MASISYWPYVRVNGSGLLLPSPPLIQRRSALACSCSYLIPVGGDRAASSRKKSRGERFVLRCAGVLPPLWLTCRPPLLGSRRDCAVCVHAPLKPATARTGPGRSVQATSPKVCQGCSPGSLNAGDGYGTARSRTWVLQRPECIRNARGRN